MSDLPTRRLNIQDTDLARDEIFSFAAELVSAGERPWFEVWYPKPIGFVGTDSEWEERQAKLFDAVEVKDGDILTLLPYAELKEAS